MNLWGRQAFLQLISCPRPAPLSLHSMNPYLDSPAKRADCVTCLKADPFPARGVLPASKEYLRTNYYYACAQCARFPAGSDARNECMTCISFTKAQAQGPPKYGILTYAELNPPAGTAPPPERDNDFGAW